VSGNSFLVCGIAGTVLSPEERALLASLAPGGIILFARNIESVAQVRALTAALRELPGNPFVAVDLEGGAVNRLRGLAGELPSPAQLAPLGAAGAFALGQACGALCAALGITVDLAPVVDVAGEGSYVGGEGRCWGSTVEAVVELAGAFLSGLEAFGVQGCLKHFPGLGSGAVDSHRELPVLGDVVREHVEAFRALAGPRRGVMVAHALAPALGEALAPASLSSRVVGSVPQGCGPVLADDVEMGALSGWGSLAERAAAALAAGCHGVLVCNALQAREAVVEHLARWKDRDPELRARLATAEGKMAGFGRGPLRPVRWEEALAQVAAVRAMVEGGA
jgi:beta-N-acetylhexosaminidase